MPYTYNIKTSQNANGIHETRIYVDDVNPMQLETTQIMIVSKDKALVDELEAIIKRRLNK